MKNSEAMLKTCNVANIFKKITEDKDLNLRMIRL